MRSDSRAEAAPAAAAAAPARKRGVRELRLERTRSDLLRAATAVIGEVGYEKASIARITARAKIAQGTFYTYFKSRQHLFDQLLPSVGEEMLAAIAGAVHGAGDLFGVEERGFRALFRYLAANPGFYRLLNEAETLAPKAHRTHFRNVVRAYVHSFELAHAHGELAGYAKREIEVLAYMLMGMRVYLIMAYARKGRKTEELPEWVTRTYLRFVGAGFRAKDEAPSTAASRRRARRAPAPSRPARRGRGGRASAR